MKLKKQRLWAAALAAILTISAGVLPAQAAEVNSSETTAAESAVTDEDTVDRAIDEVDSQEYGAEVPATEEKITESTVQKEDKAQESDQPAQEEQKILPEGSVSTVDEISYVYVEQPQLTTPDTQNIVVSFVQEDLDITEAQLTLRNEKTRETTKVEASTVKEHLVLFSDTYAQEDAGIYQLISMDYTVSGEERSLLFADQNLGELTFAVDEALDVSYISQDGQVSEPSIEAQIIKTDENGKTEDGESVQAALADAGAAVAQLAAQKATSKTQDSIVVLDPGHDSTHKGTRGNGLEEYKLTTSIAWYCKDALEKYKGVKVYLTRTGDGCPYPGKSSTEDNKARVDYAANVKADIYVSIHLNSSPSPSASGAEVYYPNSSYESWIGREGKDLSEKIITELEKLGLNNRGVHIRNSEDGTKYPDGSIADYYAVIKRSKEKGFPGIIVEHAFLSNSSDANNYLNTEAKLKKLGEADALGIAKYLGLTSDTVTPTPTPTPEVKYSYESFGFEGIDAAEPSMTLVIKSVTPVDKVKKIQYTVWNEVNGKDKALTYEGVPGSNGTFSLKILASNHGNIRGKYYAQAYAVDAKGTKHFLANTSGVMPLYADMADGYGWRYDAVKYVTNNGIMNGISGTGRFDPDEPLTRAMFATIIYRMEGSPTAYFNAKFPDVPFGNYFSVPISWANNNGIINGHSNTGLFGTYENITREDLVTILFRYTKYRGKKITGSSDLTQFPDAGTISGYAIPAMQWAVANGIVSGRGNTGLLDPKGNATRVECAAMIQRYRNNIK